MGADGVAVLVVYGYAVVVLVVLRVVVVVVLRALVVVLSVVVGVVTAGTLMVVVKKHDGHGVHGGRAEGQHCLHSLPSE